MALIVALDLSLDLTLNVISCDFLGARPSGRCARGDRVVGLVFGTVIADGSAAILERRCRVDHHDRTQKADTAN